KSFSSDLVLASSPAKSGLEQPSAKSPAPSADRSFADAMKRALTEKAVASPPKSSSIGPTPESEKTSETPTADVSTETVSPQTAADEAEVDPSTIHRMTRSGNGLRSKNAEAEKKVSALPTVAAIKASKSIALPMEEVTELAKAAEPEPESPARPKLPL